MDGISGWVPDTVGRADRAVLRMGEPLRVWRTDQVTPLSPHRNDPGPGRDLQETGGVPDHVHLRHPGGTPGQAVADIWTGSAVGCRTQLVAQIGLFCAWRAAAGRAGSIA